MRQTIKNQNQQCFFCVNMRKKLTNHSHVNCETLLQINPGLQKKKKIPIETSESEEEELDNNSKGDESFGSTRSLSSYNEHDDNED